MEEKKNKYHTSIRSRLVVAFLLFSIIPLTISSVISIYYLRSGNTELDKKLIGIADGNLNAVKKIRDISVESSIACLDKNASNSLEVRTEDIAKKVADFLYERDSDILFLSELKPDVNTYKSFINNSKKDVIVTDEKESFPDENFQNVIPWKNPDNKRAWHNSPAVDFVTKKLPLYKEITFIDLNGMEQIKVSGPSAAKTVCVDVSDKKNTYCKAETYFKNLSTLQRGEIYVSRVIGAYKKGWLYRNEKDGISVKKGSAYAGKENPDGEKFQGIVRWCTPVFDKNGEKKGYITLALDHTHIMEFTDHIVPTAEKYTAVANAGSGNYAWMWDFEDRCISHPRDFFISGYNPSTGDRVGGWLSQYQYNQFLESGDDELTTYLNNVSPFKDFSLSKLPSTDQLTSGNIPLDCKVLDFAPQCEGWHRGTADGGSGSFVIFWSGLWKLTTYAAIPYYTGIYGKSKRGFGYITFGANVNSFHSEALATKNEINRNIVKHQSQIDLSTSRIKGALKNNSDKLFKFLLLLSVSVLVVVIIVSFWTAVGITRPIRAVTKSALKISKGDYSEFIEVKSDDEIGQLANGFNEMLSAISEADRIKSMLVKDQEKVNFLLKKEIEERKETENALRISEERYRNIFESIIDVYYRTDNEGIITLVSPSAATFFGNDSVDEIIGNSVTEMYYQNPDDRKLLFDALNETGSVKNFTVHLKKKNGTKVTMETCSKYIYNENGEISGIEGVLHDVTDVREVENELKKSNTILNETIETLTNTQKQLVDAEKMAALGNLVAGVAHEINTPVGICVTAASFLQERTSGLAAVLKSGYYVESDLEEFIDSANDAVSMILSNLQRASELVSSFKKVAVDQSTEDKRVFNFKEYLKEILNSIRPKYKKDKHKFIINCTDDLMVHSYPATFFQIITNLIMNSLIHGFADTKGGEMSFDISYDGTDFIMIFSDNGIGMDDESKKQVFDPFFTTRRGKGGTGLGMNIVYNLVTMKLNGKITCDSLLGEGTSFFIAIQENDNFKVKSF